MIETLGRSIVRRLSKCSQTCSYNASLTVVWISSGMIIVTACQIRDTCNDSFQFINCRIFKTSAARTSSQVGCQEIRTRVLLWFNRKILTNKYDKYET